jgi:hypothetical protein
MPTALQAFEIFPKAFLYASINAFFFMSILVEFCRNNTASA